MEIGVRIGIPLLDSASARISSYAPGSPPMPATRTDEDRVIR